MIKRTLDVLLSCIAIVIIVPIFPIIALLIVLNSKGPVFFKQVRVGKDNKDFKVLKFRTMYVNSDQLGLLTIGDHDSRITSVGYWLRKYKIDELPQVIKVLKGDMSFVGPRPEVRKYVELYNEQQLKVLTVKPGITDWASIEFRDENEVLAKYPDPEDAYIKIIMPRKLYLNLDYIKNRSVIVDFKIIFKTLSSIFWK